MTWTEQTGNTSNYDEDVEAGTVWDGGATKWDLTGNVYLTYWDVASDSWSATTTNATTWTDA